MTNRAARALTRRQFLKLSGAGMAGAATLGAAGCNLTERIPGLPGPTPKPNPGQNVVLIILDSLRRDHVGVYGYDRAAQTPNMDALANESLRFTRAVPESMPTINARRAIHSGTRTWPFVDWDPPMGEDIILQGWQPIPLSQVTLAQVLQASGYQTMMVTDNMHQFKASYDMHRGFDVFDFFRGQTTDNFMPNWTYDPAMVDRALMRGNVPAMTAQMKQYFSNVGGRRSEADWFAPRVFTRAAEMLEFAKDDERPFFLTVDSYDPHEPWDPPEEYVRMYDDEPYDLKEPFSVIYGPSDYLEERELTRMRARYSAEVTMADRWLGRLMDKMEEMNLFEDTLVMLLADHGVALGEHGYSGKPAYALWPEITDIPFFVRRPDGKGAGDESDYQASTHDVASTVLGYLGIEKPEQMTGQDLSIIGAGAEPEERDHFTAGYHDHVWTRDDRYVMFCKNDGSGPKLYDIESDPEMNTDIAAQEPNVVKRMYDGYVLRDAGGPLPVYEPLPKPTV